MNEDQREVFSNVPCPFCGGIGRFEVDARGDTPQSHIYFIQCQDCKAHGPVQYNLGKSMDNVKTLALLRWELR